MTDDPRTKLGVLIWNQYTDWPSMRATATRADSLGYDSLWTWDHLYPIVGAVEGPMLEGYMVLAGFAAATARPTIGLMVGANTFRNPGLVVKSVTALDHLSNGRAVLGIGGAWFEAEHRAFGIAFGASVGERLRWLDESVEFMRDLLHEPRATARGEHYHGVGARNDPPPVQAHLPILVGGSGETKTLRTVARFADMWNLSLSTPEKARHKLEVLQRWCDEVGRDIGEIELTVSLGSAMIRDDPAEADRAITAMLAHNGGTTRQQRAVLSGSGAEIAAYLRGFVDLGFRHFIYHLGAPYDDETLERFATEVRPALS